MKAEFKLPAAVQKKLGWSKFVTATPAELALIDPSFAPKQQELWTFVEGTSQRSWLDRLRPKHSPGGDKHPRCPHCNKRIQSDENPCRHCGKDTGNTPPDSAAELAALQTAIRESYVKMFGALKSQGDRWVVMTEGELCGAIAVCEAFIKSARSHLKKPVEERLALIPKIIQSKD